MKKSFDIFSEKNIKKYILPFYNLENSEVSLIKFKNTKKERAVYKIEHENEFYCLKKIYFDKSNLLFVYSAVEWLYRNNLNVPKFIKTKDNKRFVEFNDILFILTPWIEGDRCDFDNLNHLFLSISELAKIHSKCKEFIPILGSAKRINFDDIYISILKHFEQIIKNSVLASRSDDKFSKIFTKYYEVNLSTAEKALKVSSSIDFERLSKSLCHGDYVNKNIVISSSKVWPIDFDKCKYGYLSYDLSYFLRRLLKRSSTNWNVSLTLDLLKKYHSINKLSSDDLRFIISYICFPQKFWRLSKDYYKRNGNKKELEKNFHKSCLNSEDQKDFTFSIINKLESIDWQLSYLK